MTKVVKRVKMTNEQAKRFYATLARMGNIGDVVALMMIKLLDEHATDSRDAWDTAARLAGYDSLAAAKQEGLRIRLDWINQEVIVEEIEDDE